MPLTLDWYDELWNNRQDLAATVLQHVMDALSSEELIGVNCLAQTIKEQGEVVMIVQFFNLHLFKTYTCTQGMCYSKCVCSPWKAKGFVCF